MIIPFTGLPESLRTALIFLFGLLIVIFGFVRESTSGFSYNQEAITELKPNSDLELEEKSDSEPIVVQEETVVITSEPVGEMEERDQSPSFISEMTEVKKRRPRRKKIEMEEVVPETEETNFDASELEN
jgi:hypothetical protein